MLQGCLQGRAAIMKPKLDGRAAAQKAIWIYNFFQIFLKPLRPRQGRIDLYAGNVYQLILVNRRNVRFTQLLELLAAGHRIITPFQMVCADLRSINAVVSRGKLHTPSRMKASFHSFTFPRFIGCA